MSRRYASRHATPELAAQYRAQQRAMRKREAEEARAAKQHAELLQKERLAIAAADAVAHEQELDAPAEPDLD